MQCDVSANTALSHRLARLKVQTGQLRQGGSFPCAACKVAFQSLLVVSAFNWSEGGFNASESVLVSAWIILSVKICICSPVFVSASAICIRPEWNVGPSVAPDVRGFWNSADGL